MPKFLILNGPNLNLLGTRQPEVYGHTTLGDIENMCQTHCAAAGAEMDFSQSNHEGVLIDLIHAGRETHDGLVINAGAYTHTSIALMDAVTSSQLPTVEVHLSNIHAREPFRHVSYIVRSPHTIGQLCGFGAQGYLFAIDALLAHLDQAPEHAG